MPKKKTTSPSVAASAKAKSAKKTASSAPAKKTNNKTSAPKKQEKKPEKSIVTTEYDSGIPAHIAVGIISFLVFIILLITAFNSEGFLLKLFHNITTGLLGIAGFYFLIPALLYISVINLWGQIRAKKSRTLCTLTFVFFAGCIYHLAVASEVSMSVTELIPYLYKTGIAGASGVRGVQASGGVLCGALAAFLNWSCGTVVSYMLIGIGTVLTLFGSVQITIPGLIRAIRGRPREDWEDEEQEEVYIEPSAKLVNKITEKQIESKKKKRQLQQNARQQLPASTAPDQEAEDYVFIPGKKALLAAPDEEFIRRQSKKEPPSVEKQLSAAAPARTDAAPLPVDKQPALPAVPSEDTRPKNRRGIFQTMQGIDDDDYAFTPVRVHAEDEFENELSSAVSYEEEAPGFTADESYSECEPSEPAIPVQSPRPRSVTVQKTTVRKRNSPAAEIPESIPAKAAGCEDFQEKVSAKDTREAAFAVASEIRQQAMPEVEYQYPKIDLLNPPSGAKADGSGEIRENTERLNKTLESFHIDARITAVTRGPSVTRYEVRLSEGVKLSKLVNCADDIALSLGASGVRIAAIPGKISIVGIEVPNRNVTMVPLREVIDSDAFRNAKSKSSFAVGKNIADQCVVGNIAKMPHMLIAGTTGSGKSVCMNSIIISLLYKAGPEDVKLIMVDPKMVELGIYNGIPHLLIPVVTDPKKAAGSLQWAVTEMLRRYKMMSEIGVRDLASYNQEITETENGKKLPQIVIIIDELADLMLVAAKEVEDSICRIAQMGRAAGMHLIIATQRPSADVITGLMKANIPSRIAFAVASAMESRIILDTMGADKLVGKGDMLYAPIGEGKPLRVQGCFVSDAEVERVAKFVKSNSHTEYDSSVQDAVDRNAQATGKGAKSSPATASDPAPSDDELEGDEMLPAAVDVILETGQASVSMLQRRLKLGYARAARIVDEMEEKGYVGPFQGSKPRAILITKEKWAAMRGGSDTDPVNEIN